MFNYLLVLQGRQQELLEVLTNLDRAHHGTNVAQEDIEIDMGFPLQ